MRTISLTQNKVALVDDADYEWLSQRKWWANQHHSTFYAAQGAELMHRAILGLQPGDKRQCDHRDGNGLNNQRSNLRICTQTQNIRSQRKRKNTTSRYKGIYWHCRDCKWCSRIRVNNNLIWLGYFNSEIEAAKVYDAAAIEHHGEFALTNKALELRK